MPTLTEGSRTRIDVERLGRGLRDRVWLQSDGAAGRPVVRPMLCPLPGAAGTRISLVPDGALLLAGDAVDLQVHVGAGARLEIVEPGGTVAYDMRGGAATWSVAIEIEDGGVLTWAGRQFVAAAGSSTRRVTRADLGEGARLALRETLVLGRHGEAAPGVVESDLAVCLAGRPLLVDALLLDGGRSARAAVGGNRVIGSVMVAGVPLTSDGALACSAGRRFDLEGPGTLLRTLTDDAHAAVPTGWWSAAVEAMGTTS